MIAAALLRIAVDPALRAACAEPLKVASHRFQRVSVAGVEVALQRDVPLTRAEEPYRVAYEYARLILRMGGLSDGASRRGFAFLIDLEKLFESAVQRSSQASRSALLPPRA